jgi:hypothetical protein
MSVSLSRSRGNKSRVNSIQLQERENRLRRDGSFTRKKPVTREDAYSYALRAAYLSYLIQPRQKRLQHVAGIAAPAPKSGHKSAAIDLLKDFGVMSASSSRNKFPHAFMDKLDKRLTGVLMGRERLPEYNNDPLIKRSFAVFLNEFKSPVFRKNMERDRKMEELLLIFYSSAVKELQKGKTADDDSWRWLVDRHFALFIRLISSIMKDNEWTRERPELTARLANLEKKLLVHDLDLAHNSSNGGGHTIEVEVPLTHEVKDMPLALTVSRIFEMSYDQVQQDINYSKANWTAQAALQDLKTYQQCISLTTKATINPDSFDTEEAFEAWKRNEIPEITQLMLEIMSTYPELAKTTTGSAVPQLHNISPTDNSFADLSRKLSEQSDNSSGFTLDSSIDFAGLSMDSSPKDGVDVSFTFIPPDQRLYYRAVLKYALAHDLREEDEQHSPDGDDSLRPVLMKKTTDLLKELGSRWRVPSFSRRILLLDAVRELLQTRDIDLDDLDRCLVYFKEASQDSKKLNRKSVGHKEALHDWTKWTLDDYSMYQRGLLSIHDEIQAELFQVMQGAYDAKSPSFGQCLYLLQTHIYSDEHFPKSTEDRWSEKLTAALKQRAEEAYKVLLRKNIPEVADTWEFYHIIELGKAVVALCIKIQKRYSKAPEILG